MISRRNFLLYCSGLLSTSSFALGGPSKTELSYLCWDGYDQPDLLVPFEKQHHCTIHPEIISDSPAAFAKLNQGGHRQYDIASMDSPWLERLDQEELLATLPKAWFHELQQHYYPELIALFFNDTISPNWLPTQWGWIGLTINTDYVKETDYQSYSACFSRHNRGKIGIMDWGDWPMLPIALYLGINPYETLDRYALQHLQDAFKALFDNHPVFLSGVAIGQKALLDGSVNTMIGTGTYLTSAMRRAGFQQVKTTIPRIKGGIPQCIVWTEGSGAIKGQQHEALSLLWTRYTASEQAAMQLSYNGPTCNISPYHGVLAQYSEQQRDTLQLEELPNLWQSSLAHRSVPSIASMLEAWQTELMRAI